MVKHGSLGLEESSIKKYSVHKSTFFIVAYRKIEHFNWWFLECLIFFTKSNVDFPDFR